MAVIAADPGPAVVAGATSFTTMQPVVFDDLFGWFSPGTRRRGVILCGTFGSEQLAAYRPWRDLGEAIAATGCATLRFDYPGEGDSGEHDGARVARWTAAIHRAIRTVREAGADEIALVGLRLGATLAALVAQEGGIDRLVLIAPFRTGRAYLREVVVRSGQIDRLPDGTPFPKEQGALALAGFRLGPDLIADLEAVKLDPLGAAPVPDVLLLEAPADLSAGYASAGGAVTSIPFPGLAKLLAKPHVAQEPDPAFATIVDFVTGGAPLLRDFRRQSGQRPAETDADPADVGTPPHGPCAVLCGETWSEEAVRFGPDMFGILCRPQVGAPQQQAVLFLSSGLNVRSGYGRQTTRLARRFAAQGIPSLRIDLRGIGDSGNRPDGLSPLFNLDARDDVAAAIDELGRRVASPVVLIGFCSGAHLAFHATCRDPRVAAAILVNMPGFDWTIDDDVSAASGRSFRSTATYAMLVRRRAAWRRVLTGEVRLAAILDTLARRIWSKAARRARALIRPIPAERTVAGRIATLRRRGVELLLVYSANDIGLSQAHAHLGQSAAKVRALVGRPLCILEHADHNLGVGTAFEAFATHAEAMLAGLRARDHRTGARPRSG